nr:DNA primase [Candidatus Phytoplasma sacchari]
MEYKMNDSLIKKINKKISILELVINCGIDLKKTGKNFMGFCPFHSEKTPSFSVSPEKNIALCMSCLSGGSPIKFYKQFRKISTSEAIIELSKKFDLKLSFVKKKFFSNPLYQILEDTNEYYVNSLKSFFRYDIQYDLLNNPDQHKKIDLKDFFRKDIEHPLCSYLENRKLSFELIEKFKLGFADFHYNSLTRYLLEIKKNNLENLLKLCLIKKKENKDEYYDFFRNRLIFPLTDFQGKLVGFVGRLIDENKKNKVKYLFNSETIFFKKSNLLYRFFEHYNFIKEKNEIILCEGFFDVISFFKIDKKNVVATMGTQLTKYQINLLKKITYNVLIAYDGDISGKESSLKNAQLLNNNGFIVKILFFPNNMDPDQYINLSIQNNLDFNVFLRNNSKEFIFYMIEDKINKKESEDFKQLEEYVFDLLKYHSKEIQEYYQKEIYVRYQIYVNLNYYEINRNYFVINKNSYIDKKIRSNIENNITINEVNIINDIFLNREYINFIRDDIINYISNPFIIEIIDKVKEYYEIYSSSEENNNGINIERFLKTYNVFLNKLNSYFPIYDLLLEIRKSFFFKKKKRIENQEDLKIFYFQLKINNIYKEIEKIKQKRDNILKEKIFFEEPINKEIFKEFIENIKLKDKEIQKKKEEIEKIKEEIRILNKFKIVK